MLPEDSPLTPRETHAAEALRTALHEIAAEHPLRHEAFHVEPLNARPRRVVPGRQLAGAAAVALVTVVAVAGVLAVRNMPGPGPSGPSPFTASASPARVGPAPTKAGLGSFEPILDVAEPQTTTGSAAMHESLGSASDGAVFLKDYGSSEGGGDNVYHVTLYRTFDGIQWQSVGVPTPTDQQDSQVACRGWNCVVVSEYPQNGRLLVTDDGKGWDSVETSPGLFQTSLTAGPSGFVMSGYQLGNNRTRTLFSPDGRTWQDVRFAAGSQALTGGVTFSDPGGPWLMLGARGSAGEPQLALSNDGLTWQDVEDPDHLYATTYQVGRSVFHFGNRWYLLARYSQAPAGTSGGGFGRPGSTSTPIAVWQTIYWLEDGSAVLHSSGRLSAVFPDEVVAMDGFLVGARTNSDFTASLMISTDVTTWSDEGLLPPGVPVPGSLHGLPVYYLPPLARAGANVIVEGTALKPGEMGSGLYVARPLG